MLFARQNSLPFHSHSQQSGHTQAPTGPSARQAVVALRGAYRIANQTATEPRSPGVAMATGAEIRAVRSAERHYGVSAMPGKGPTGTLLGDPATLEHAGAGCKSSSLEGSGVGAERFAAKRNRHALELLGACMMIASFLVLALFA